MTRLGRRSVVTAVLSVAILWMTKADFIIVYPVPNNGDCCVTYRLMSEDLRIAYLLRHIEVLVCPQDTVVNSQGVCVYPDSPLADRCRAPDNFNQDVVDRICSYNPSSVFADPFNCSWYYDCSSSQPDKHVQCPVYPDQGTFDCYDDVTKICGPATEVRCGRRPVRYTQKQIEDICWTDNSRLIVNSDTCNGYYHCGMLSDPAGRFQPFHSECNYLELFDLESGRCAPYSEVYCGLRKPVKAKCELQQSSCGISSHCKPCDEPDCSGEPNGIRPDHLKPYTPYYAVCEDGWLVRQGTCPGNLLIQQIFDPTTNKCEFPFSLNRTSANHYEE